MEAARKLRRAVDASENKIKNYWLRNRDILFYLKSFKVIEKYLPFRKGNFGESFLQVFQNGVLSVSRLCLVELYTQIYGTSELNNGKLDHTIQKDATSKVSSSPRPEAGSTCKANVPSIIIHNGSPTIFCNSPEALPSSEGSHSQAVEKGEALINFEMSLGDDAVTSQPIPSVNNAVNGQRPVNCLPVPPPASPLKQNSLNTTLTSGCKNLTKSNTVPSRSKIDRCVAKQDTFEVDNDVMPVAPKLRNNPKVKLLQRSHAVREETSPPREVELSHASSNNSTEKIAINKTVNGATNNNNNNNNNNNSNNNNINNINNNNNNNNSSSMINNSNLVNSNSNSSNKNHNNKVGNVTSQTNNPSYQGGNSLQVNNNIVRPNSRHKLRHQGSSQGSVDNSSPCLSRDSSTEQYTDNSGIDLNQFITDTLNRNFKDRMLLLQIEQDLISLVKDTKKAYQKFPVMSSYQRMLVHRVAAFFGMDHNVDQSGNCVVVNITSSTRIPEVRFSELIREDCRFGEEPRRCILKRDSSSFEEGMQLRSPERQLSGDSRRSKSFEEREEEYERARKRIFNRDDGFPIDSPYRSHDINSRRSSHEDLRWHGEPQPWSSSDSDICSGRGRPTSTPRINHISKVESFEGNDTLKANSLKGSVLKSYSFGGYPGMTRGDSISSSGSRPLIKQADSITSSVSSARLSPSSSGYKSQSARSDATASTTPSPNQATSQCSFSPEPNTVVWAVSSLTAVPPGAVLINPASGQPYTNPDGSLYRYDPDNPIKLCPTIEEDGPTNILSSPNSGTLESNSDTPEDVIQEKLLVDTTDSCVEQTHPGTTDTKLASAKSVTVFINSSTSPSLPELTHNDTMATKEKIHQSESMRVDSSKNGKLIVPCQDETPQINTSSGRLYPSTLDGMSVEVAHTNFNGIESENNSYKDYVGGGDVNGVTNCQGDGREYSGQNNYQVNFAINSNVHNTPEYGSQAASGSAFLNSGLGVASVNYALGPPYSAETVHMPAEMLYSQSVIYAAGQQGNTYGVVHTPATPSTPAAPPPPPPQATAVPAPATATSYEARPNEANPSVAVPELSNYFMGLNIGNEHIPSATTPASQMGYWGPSPNTSQTQGSSHSSQIQMYYLPGSLPTGTIHPKYAPPTPSVYTYNVPPVVYPTEICSSVIPNTATAVFQTPYYAPASNTAMTYRAQTPPTPSAVAATAVAPTGFFVYHPQPAAPPPPQIQFGMVRPQQQVPGIRSSPPPGPRTRMPYNRSISERARHGSFNVDHKANSLHFSPLSVYGLRFMPGEIQPIGMMRPVANVRPALATSNSNIPRHPIVTQCCANDLTASRPPRPRKQR